MDDSTFSIALMGVVPSVCDAEAGAAEQASPTSMGLAKVTAKLLENPKRWSSLGSVRRHVLRIQDGSRHCTTSWPGE